jgi:hypothetical protein
MENIFVLNYWIHLWRSDSFFLPADAKHDGRDIFRRQSIHPEPISDSEMPEP